MRRSSSCTPGDACTTNRSAPCKTGVIACQNDQPTCVDDSDVTDGTTCAAGVYAVPLSGGIILLLAQDLTVGASGSITATATPSSRDTSSAGGYVFIRGGTLSLGTAQVTALGGSASGQGVNAGTPVTAGDGYIVVKGTTVTGTTSPAAHQL